MRIGDTVIVQRAGDVIPQIVGVVPDKRPKGAKPYMFPDALPGLRQPRRARDQPQDRQGDVVRRCTGGLICPAQAVERLKHFVSRNAFDIEGLGEKQIQAFFDDGLIQPPQDIFTLEARDAAAETRLRGARGLGATRRSRNLFAAIEARRSIALDRFIFALGIRHVGETTARVCSPASTARIEALPRRHAGSRQAAGQPRLTRELDAIEGIGEVVAEAIADFFAEPHNVEVVRRAARRSDARSRWRRVRPCLGRRRQDRRVHRLAGEA